MSQQQQTVMASEVLFSRTSHQHLTYHVYCWPDGSVHGGWSGLLSRFGRKFFDWIDGKGEAPT